VGFGQNGVFDVMAAMDKMENVIGSRFDDDLSGDNAANAITGGLGADRLTGYGGADRFVFTAVAESTAAAPDTITDFEVGVDKIDLSQIDANTNTSENESFTFIGSTAFSRVSGQLAYIDGVLSGDVDGDGFANFKVNLANKAVLSEGDFVL
jgi:Ca2+-binding RTX toxin-like protein